MRKDYDSLKQLFRGISSTFLTFSVSWIFFWFWSIRLNPRMDRSFLGKGNWAMVAIYCLLVVLFFRTFGGYDIGKSRISGASLSAAIAIAVVDFIMFMFTVMLIGRVKFIKFILVTYLWMLVLDVCMLFLLIYFGTWAYRQIFPPFRLLEITGKNEGGLQQKLQRRPDKYRITGVVPADTPSDEIIRILDDYDAVLLNDVPSSVRNSILKICFDRKIRVYYTPKLSDIILKEADELNMVDSPLYLSRNNGFSFEQRVIKRLMDICISLVGIIITSPLMIGAAIAIKVYDHGPVFYRQERYTIGHKRFWVMKFRSMVTDAEKDGKARLATQNDDRITPVGRFIRATRIDELPQFFNILIGDMSVVGPRPERPEIHQEYCEKVPEFDFRLSVKAGLTGYAQVYGKYNTTTYDKLKFDMMYVQKTSILLDIQLILLTLRVIFQKEATEGLDEGETTAK